MSDGSQSADHDSWHAAFLDYDLLDWLLYQRRGEASDYPPGKILFKNRLKHLGESAASWLAVFNPPRWRPWQYAIELGIPLLLAIALFLPGGSANDGPCRRNRRGYLETKGFTVFNLHSRQSSACN